MCADVIAYRGDQLHGDCGKKNGFLASLGRWVFAQRFDSVAPQLSLAIFNLIGKEGKRAQANWLRKSSSGVSTLCIVSVPTIRASACILRPIGQF